jgi:glycosyltransferase involved in cell wall biosynthesis
LPRPPHPARDGLAIRNYHLLEALARQFRVRAFVLAESERAAAEGIYPADVAVEAVPQAARTLRRSTALLASLVGEAYSLCLYRSRALVGRLAKASSREKPAWLVAHSYHVGPAAIRGGGPVWIDFHNVDSEIWRRMGKGATSPAVRLFARLQAPRVEHAERRLVAESAGFSCVSERDRRRLAPATSPGASLVVPNGVDFQRYAYRTEPALDEVVLFVGDLSWPPNREGVRWFRERVWDLVVRQRPQARAEILGRGAPLLRRAAARPDFLILGEQADTRPHWRRAAVSVVPIRVAGGTRLKILEAAACGVPVVSTPIGAEGLDLSQPDEIRIAEAPEAFAAAICELLADRDGRRRQAEAARRRVETRYAWDAIGASFAEELSRRAERRA